MADAKQAGAVNRAPFHERVVLAMPAPLAVVYRAGAGIGYDSVAICTATMTPDLGLPGWTLEDLVEHRDWDFAVIPDLPQEAWHLTTAGVEPHRLLRAPEKQLVRSRRIGLENRFRRAWHALATRAFRVLAAVPRRVPPIPPSSIGSRLVIFGTGVVGRQVLRNLEGWATPVAFCDNDAKRWRSIIEGVPVVGPADLGGLAYDGIIVASAAWPEICRQLLERGCSAGRIDLARTQTVLNTKPGPVGLGHRAPARIERTARLLSTPPEGTRE